MKNSETRLMIVAVLSALISMVFAFIRLGISISLFLLLIFWIITFIGVFSKSEMVKSVDRYRIWIVVTVFVISMIMISMLEPAVSSLQNSRNSEPTTLLTADECKPIYDEYNESIMDVTGEGINGTIGVKIDPMNCKADVYYNFIFDSNIPKNYTPTNATYSEYRYAGGVTSDEDPDYVSGEAEIYALYNSSYQLGDPYDFGLPQDVSTVAQQQMSEGVNSSTFYLGWSRKYNFREDSLQKLQDLDKFRVYEGKESMIEEETPDGYFSYYLDSEAAVENGKIVDEYQLTFIIRP